MSILRVDARGTLCPEPVLRTRQALRGIAPGQCVEVLATDVHAELDLEVFCVQTGHTFVACEKNAEGALRLTIRKAGS